MITLQQADFREIELPKDKRVPGTVVLIPIFPVELIRSASSPEPKLIALS